MLSRHQTSRKVNKLLTGQQIISQIVSLGILCVALLSVFGCSSTLRLKMTLQATSYDIPMFGRTAARDFTDSSTFTFPLSLAWEYDASAGFGNGSPVIVGNVLIIGTMQGELHAVDLTTGKRIRYIKIFSPISSSPVVYQRYVIFGIESTEENLISVDTHDGSIRWAKNAGGVASSPVLKENLLFVGGLDGSFHCFEAAYGSTKWRVNTGSPIRSSPCAWNDLVFCANSSGEVFAYTINHGQERWKFSTGNAVFAGLTASEGKLFVGSRDSCLYILDAVTGSLHQKISIGNKIMSSPAVGNGMV
ncbi:MAG: PQQ-binding-like beta-propeller repeat protein, partial [Bacteriovoracaceae bacterium]